MCIRDRSSEIFFGQSYDITQRVETDPNSGFHDGSSDWVGRAAFDTGKWFSIHNRARFAQDNFNLRHLESTARFGTKNYIYVGYIYATQFLDIATLGNTTQEVIGGVGVGLTNHLSVRARTTYNIAEQMIQKQSMGLFYDHPCYTASLEYMENNARRQEEQITSTTIKFQFALKLSGDKKIKPAE